MNAGQVLVNAEVDIEDVIEFLDELDGFGLVTTNNRLLAKRLAALGLAHREE